MAERLTAASLVVWSLACYGVTLIITGSYLLSGVRRRVASLSTFLGKLVSCPMCTGFWVGVAIPVRVINAGHPALDALLSGAASSAVCFAAHVTLAKLGAEEM